MPKLEDLLNEYGTDEQRRYIQRELERRNEKNIPENQVARECLRELWVKYDYAGISVGRSLRAEILEEAQALVRALQCDQANELLSILLAMYHSPDFINNNSWYDFKVEKDSLPLTERTLLTVACMKLGIVEVPPIEFCTKENILEKIRNSKEKRRALKKG